MPAAASAEPAPGDGEQTTGEAPGSSPPPDERDGTDRGRARQAPDGPAGDGRGDRPRSGPQNEPRNEAEARDEPAIALGETTPEAGPAPGEGREEGDAPPPGRALQPPREFVVVGLGASAGGLEACRSLLEAMPRTSRLALVLIQHLDPDRESLLAQLLERYTALRVIEARDGVELAPDTLYVNAPGTLLHLEGETLRVRHPASPRSHRTPIDTFLTSLAEVRGPDAVAVVLSGTGQDGSLGLRAIKEHGGMTIAQDEATAKYTGMPRSAAATGQVDHVLPIKEIPARLDEYARYRQELGRENLSRSLEEDIENHLDPILDFLEGGTGHDFRHYKQNTVLRRIMRRLNALQLTSAADYVSLLSTDPGEVQALFQDLLIGVTRFFRNQGAFEQLEREVVLPILRAKEQGEPVRVWVIGCATGEEAYSVAILFHEHITRLGLSTKLQMFATDIDGGALEMARAGRYSSSISADIPSSLRLQRYFETSNDGYRVIKAVRESVIFSRHDLIGDPPFSHLDLITCRNVLIYLDKEIQRRLMPLFHYALSPKGYLFLGPSEGVSQDRDLFTTLDSEHRLFRAREGVAPTTNFKFPLRGRSVPTRQDAELLAFPNDLQRVDRTVERLLLKEYVPASVVIDERGEVVYFSAETSLFLQPPQGAPSLDLLTMAREGLRMPLRAVVHEAVRKQQRTERGEIRLHQGNTLYQVKVIVHPLPPTEVEARLYLVVFQIERSETFDPLAEELVESDSDDPVLRELERELHATREHLQSTIEELETSNEELRSSNEELMSMNEELQTSNEELETSKEELQSVNEELETVNAELSAKLDELAQSNADLKNLLESTRIATIFLDQNLCIQRFTPAIRKIFPLVEGDLRRPITDLGHRMSYSSEDLRRDAHQVIETLVPRELQVELLPAEGPQEPTGGSRAGDPPEDPQPSPWKTEWYMVRILPYRTLQNTIDGVVMTFVDITEIRWAQGEIHRLNQELHRRIAELEATLDLIPVGIAISDDPRCETIRVNSHGSRLLNSQPQQNISRTGEGGKTATYRTYRDEVEIAPEELPMQRAALTGREVRDERIEIVRDDGHRIEILMSASPLLDSSGEVTGAVGAYVDLTEEIRTRREIERRARQQAAIADLSMRAVAAGSAEDLFAPLTEAVAETMGVEFAKVLELTPDGEHLHLRAGVGWEEGLVGEALVPARTGSQASYTLSVGAPVIVADLAAEPRFTGPQLLLDHEIRSGISVVIPSPDGPWGILGVHSSARRSFTEDDIAFVQAAANVLTATLERDRIRQELRRSQQELDSHATRERLMRTERLAALGTLAAGIAHEINNPINSISMTAETAQMALRRKQDERLERDLEVIVQEAVRCGEIVANVLDFVRDRQAKKAPRDLNHVVLRAVEIHRRSSSPEQVEIRTELTPDLPPVPMNSTEIEQVILNLIRNAMEAQPTGDLRVTLHTRRSPAGVLLDIEDNGPGIPAENRDRVFDPFFTTRRDRGGAGLGLSLAHEIVVQGHGGRLDLWSAEGRGTRFEIELPLEAASSELPEVAEPPTET